MVEQTLPEEDAKDETFIEVPAILEKFKASAAVTDGTYHLSDSLRCSIQEPSYFMSVLY